MKSLHKGTHTLYLILPFINPYQVTPQSYYYGPTTKIHFLELCLSKKEKYIFYKKILNPILNPNIEPNIKPKY